MSSKELKAEAAILRAEIERNLRILAEIIDPQGMTTAERARATARPAAFRAVRCRPA
jgi:hypothetical protein